MATDMFLKLDGIDGEATSKYPGLPEGCIDVHSMTFGVSNPTAVGRTGAGLGTGKTTFSEISFTKFTDKSSPKLFQTAGSGTHIKSAVFTGWKSSGSKPLKYFQVSLYDVAISAFQNGGAAGSEMTESLSFAYSRIEFNYFEQKADGSQGATNQGAFNVRDGVAA